DRHPQLVTDIKDDVALAVRLDSTDRDALLSQDIDKVDVCVVAIGENFEASLLTTVLVKEMGIPKIICRAQTALHAEIFRQIGASQVIQPEQAAGLQVARQLANPQLADVIPLSADFSLIELKAPREFHGKSVENIGLRAKYQVNLVVIMRPQEGAEVIPGRDRPMQTRVPRPDDVIRPDDTLILVGANESLANLPKE
ncbi:MAG: TrkA family potassium uptake protein, partial [Planctomycetaceae bacterium]|nr:TrkA family potassium uptake protein [Planctomycetaceae bacterium]